MIVGISCNIEPEITVILKEQLNYVRVKHVLCDFTEIHTVKSSLKEKRQIVNDQLIHFGYLSSLQYNIIFFKIYAE